MPVICIETRHAKAFLKAQVNKSDRNDARGIAQMMRVNLYRPVHVKTLRSQHRRALLTARKLLQEKAIAIENDIRGLLRNFGLKVGAVGMRGFEARIRDMTGNRPELHEIVTPLLAARLALRDRFAELHRLLLAAVKEDKVCRRLMTFPGVGPVVSLAYRHDRRAGTLPHRQVRRSADAGPASIRREQSHRSCLALRRCDDARAALRSGAGAADAGHAMVLVEGLGDGGGEAPRPATGDRGAGAQARGHHASYVDRRHGLPLDQAGQPGR